MTLERPNRIRSTDAGAGRARSLALGAIALLLLAAGFWGWMESLRRADQRFRRNLIRKAIAVARTFPVHEARALTFTEADRDRPEFLRISAQLRAYSRAAGLRCLYTMALRDGRLFFGPEGLDPESPLSSPAGTEYLEPTEADFQIFETSKPLVQGPCTDEYGPYIGATAPVLDPETGRVILVVGLDEDPSAWEAELRKAQRLPLLVPILGFVILGIALIRMRRRRAAASVSRHALFSVEVVSCTLAMLLLTAAVTQLIHDMDRAGQDEMFNSQAQLKANAVSDAFLEEEGRMKALSELFTSSAYITRDEFGGYCREALASNLVLTHAWLPATPADKVEDLERHAIREGLPEYRVQRSADPASGPLFPVLYQEPVNSRVYSPGVTVSDDPRCREAITACFRTGRTTSASAAPLAGEDGPAPFIQVFRPAGNAAQRGVVSFVLDPAWLADAPVAGVDDLSVTLMEIAPDGKLEVLSCSRGPCGETCLETMQQGHHRFYPFFSFGRTYALLVAPDPGWYALYPLRNARIVLAAGLILTLLSSGLIAMLVNRPASLEKMIQERTADLQRSEERFDMAASAARIGLWDLDLESGVLLWDPRMYALYGIGPDDFSGTAESWEERVHPDDLETAKQEAAAALRGEKPYETEFRIVRPSGDIRHIQAFAKIRQDHKGRPVRMIGLNLDITEDKLREKRITQQLDELNRWQQVMMDREDRVIELKREINRLLQQFDLPIRYREVLEEDK